MQVQQKIQLPSYFSRAPTNFETRLFFPSIAQRKAAQKTAFATWMGVYVTHLHIVSICWFDSTIRCTCLQNLWVHNLPNTRLARVVDWHHKHVHLRSKQHLTLHYRTFYPVDADVETNRKIAHEVLRYLPTTYRLF